MTEEQKKIDDDVKRKAFAEMKRKSQSGEMYDFLRSQMRFNVGTHRKTRLKKVGAAGSGSLLHVDVAAEHEKLFKDEYNKRVDLIGVKNARNRLKWVTILQEVVDPNVEDVSWAVERLENQFKENVRDVGLWSRGAIELEIVNVALLEGIAERDEGEQRKLETLTGMWGTDEYQGMKIFSDKSRSKVLVHAHIVVDLGADFERNEELLREKFDKVNSWNRAKRQVFIKSLESDKTVKKSMNHLAYYVTKGGNVTKHGRVEYKANFGEDTAEHLDRQMAKKGLGRADKGSETIEDERGLTAGDLAKLDELIVWLMNRRKDKRGYLVSTNGRR